MRRLGLALVTVLAVLLYGLVVAAPGQANVGPRCVNGQPGHQHPAFEPDPVGGYPVPAIRLTGPDGRPRPVVVVEAEAATRCWAPGRRFVRAQAYGEGPMRIAVVLQLRGRGTVPWTYARETLRAGKAAESRILNVAGRAFRACARSTDLTTGRTYYDCSPWITAPR
jgi:hypothetical protein